jgi:hypothetical protein
VFLGEFLVGVQRFQDNDLGLCVGSPELAGFFYASFLLLGLDRAGCALLWWGSHVPVVVTLGPWGYSFLVYVPMSFVWKR